MTTTRNEDTSEPDPLGEVRRGPQGGGDCLGRSVDTRYN